MTFEAIHQSKISFPKEETSAFPRQEDPRKKAPGDDGIEGAIRATDCPAKFAAAPPKNFCFCSPRLSFPHHAPLTRTLDFLCMRHGTAYEKLQVSRDWR